MTALRVLGIIIFVVSLSVCHHANGQTTSNCRGVPPWAPLTRFARNTGAPTEGRPYKAQAQPETAAIDALYGEWIKATATKGADGYVSFFVADGAVLPPSAPAVEGKDAIRQWIQKELDEYTLKDGRFVPGSLKVANGWAIRRFSIAGKRVPKKGGEPVPVNNKYLDVLQKQADGSWKFVYRMWSSNE